MTQGTTTTESYTYDAVGNRLSSLGVSPYTYNSSNELLSTPITTYTYDKDGNLKTKVDSTGTTTYNWNTYTNRLSSVVLPGSGGTISFKYDPFGRRMQKSGPSTTTNYLYDGANLIEELDGGGNVLARYTQGIGIDQPLSELRSTTSSYYHQDAIGSVTSLSNSAGAVANTYTYDSFGYRTASTGTITNPFQYTGREFDAETVQYFYRARYLDQNLGRFVSEDPIRSGFNFYTYVRNNPATFLDPFGLRNCTRTPSGIVCYPDSNSGTTEFDPQIPSLPTHRDCRRCQHLHLSRMVLFVNPAQTVTTQCKGVCPLRRMGTSG